MSETVESKRKDAHDRYDACIKVILDIVKGGEGSMTLPELDKLSQAVEDARSALKEVDLWDGVIKSTKEEKNA